MRRSSRIAMIVLLLLVIGVVVYYKSTGGKTSGCNIEPIESAIYTQDDYDEACKVAFKYFNNVFEGCTMTAIRYAGDDRLDSMEEWADEYGVEEVIILESDFKSGNNMELGLEPNQEYTDWQWILTRKKGGKWRHRDHGYG